MSRGLRNVGAPLMRGVRVAVLPGQAAVAAPGRRPPFGATPRGLQRQSPTSSTLSTGAFTVCCHLTAYGRRVSGVMENRAAVFTNQPQSVEVYQAGAWWSGELLGWRHDADGSCQVWVRVVLGGVEESAWTDLASLRLPERHLSVAAGSPSPGAYSPPTQAMSVSRHPAGRRAPSVDSDPSATASLPLVRDLSVVPDRPAVAASGGRRRAPDAPVESTGGRRRAPESVPASTTGGRRRAPENTPVAAAATSRPLGRHHAPADAGRHRTADTGLFPVVSVDAPAAPAGSRRPAPPLATGRGATSQSGPAGRPQEGARERVLESWTPPQGLEPELLTRPMRLSDQAPHSRRPRVDGSLRSV